MEPQTICALICRAILLVLLAYGIALSIIVMSSCQFISAVSSPDESTHGVGLLSYEAIDGSCTDHNSFIIDNYNGMEKSAKVGGYVAPSCAALVILLIFLECCNRAKWGGKCIPCILLLGAVICQGITFLIFNSELFCNNKDIIECNIGDGGYRSIQATLVYSFCFILYTFGPTPIPLFKNIQSKIHHQEERKGNKSGKKKKGKKKKKKKLTEPGKGEEWTKEMYEARRKERKVKSRGVSGRRKEEIFDDMGMGGGGDSPKEFGENSMMLYDTDQQYQGKEEKSGGRSRSSKSRGSRGSSSRGSSRSKHQEPKYDEYVDTEPDGMDWSAFTPEQREEYYEQQRIKERKRKDRERRKRDKMQQWEEDGLGNPYGGGGSDYSSSRRREDEEMGDSRRGSGAYSVIDYENGSVRHNDSYYSRDSRAQDSYYSQDRGGERGYDDSYYSRGDDGYADRGDDYQQDDYQQDDYYEDEDLPPKNDSYYDDSPRSSSRHSRSASGRSRGSQYNDSYYSRDSYDRDSRYQDNL